MDIMAIVSIVLFSMLTLVFNGLTKFYLVVDQRKLARVAVGFALVSLIMSNHSFSNYTINFSF